MLNNCVVKMLNIFYFLQKKVSKEKLKPYFVHVNLKKQIKKIKANCLRGSKTEKIEQFIK